MRRLPLRVRVTAAFAAVMLTLLGAIAVLAYQRMSAALLDEIDSDLRFRAAALTGTTGGRVDIPDARLQEPREAFEQFLAADGRVVRATSGFERALISGAEVTARRSPWFTQRSVAGVASGARLLVVPQPGGGAIVVGSSLADRHDALRELVEVLLIGGPVAVALACAAAWRVAGWALTPVERMRREAASISLADPAHRMPVPPARDELQRLALTLNDMLDRLERALSAERRFLERAGHELRTPLTALRAELDLALARPRTPDELARALRSVSEDVDRLVRLSEDLLVLARADDGRLPVRREPIAVRELLDESARTFAARADTAGVRLAVEGCASAAFADPLRLRQVLTNLLDNALRHTPAGGTVALRVTDVHGDVVITVADSGPGFGAPADGPGLGLRLVRTVVAAHGGSVRLGTGDAGGAQVVVTLPHG